MIIPNSSLTGLWVGFRSDELVRWLLYVDLININDDSSPLWSMEAVIQKWPGDAPKPSQIVFMTEIRPHMAFMPDAGSVSFDIKSHTWIDDRRVRMVGDFNRSTVFSPNGNYVLVAKSTSPYAVCEKVR